MKLIDDIYNGIQKGKENGLQPSEITMSKQTIKSICDYNKAIMSESNNNPEYPTIFGVKIIEDNRLFDGNCLIKFERS